MTKNTIRLTMAQALVKYLANQHVARDGHENRFFAGMWGIFGHGNVGGDGPGSRRSTEARSSRYLSKPKNEQSHGAHRRRPTPRHRQSARHAYACTTSIGPGATNMVTGAAGATVNRIPCPACFPGDIFAESGIPAPVLQQLESPHTHGRQRQRLLSSRSRATGIASTVPSKSSPPCRKPCAS